MAIVDPYIGRRDAFGLGIETVPGTSVAPQVWFRWMSHGLQTKTTPIENESVLGVVDRVSDSAIGAKWVEGTVGGPLSSEAIGYLHLGMFSAVSVGAPVSGIYPHTFSNNQSTVPKTMTVGTSGPLGGWRHPYGVIDNLEVTAEAGGYVEFSTAVKARIGASSSDTVATASETLFTSEHIVVKVAADVSSLSSAPAIKAASTKLVLERPSEAFHPLGTVDLPEFDRGAFEARGELVVRLTDTQYGTDFLSNAVKAMSISLVNGTKSLTYTASKVRYRELEKTRDRDKVVTATIQFFCEFDTSTNASIVPVLKNSVPAYVAA